MTYTNNMLPETLKSYPDRRKFIYRIILWSVLLGGLIALMFVQTVVNAQPATPINPCNRLGGCLEGINSYNSSDSRTGIVRLIVDVSRFLIFVGGGVAVFFIVLGGYSMITSNGDSKKFEQGRNTLVYAVIGLVVAVVSVTIVSLIGSIVPGLNLSQQT